MKYIFCLLLIAISTNTYSQNLQLRANLSYGSTSLSNIGGYTDSLDNEYALVGTYNGLDVVDVTDPANPVIRFSVTGTQSDWREVKTYRKYAYIATEGGGGLTVVDLSNLPASINQKQYTGDGVISGQLDAIHALHCDTAKGFLYLYGCSFNQGNTVFIDLQDPWNPVYAGEYVFPGSGSDIYVHDGFAMNDTLYEGHIYPGFFAVVDVTNKSNPILLATQTTPTSYTHNTWLSDDHRTLFTTDENSGSFLGAYDVSDLSNIRELSRYQTNPGSGAIVHNTHILNDYAVTSWYKEGVVIVDVARPANPIEVGRYDTYPQGSGDGFNGCWGVFPFLPSGTVVASDIDNGLFVLTPTYIRGCYLEGVVTDSITGTLLSGALVEVLVANLSRTSDASGEFRTGTAAAGSYDIQVSRPGYYTKIITGISLSNGVLTNLNIQLAPLPNYPFSGVVTDSLTGLPVTNVTVVLESNDLTYTATSNSNGLFTFPGVVLDTYTMITGKWGYQTSCKSITLVQSMPIDAILAPGYYDDFTLDFGWSVMGSSNNAWERGEPVGTYNGNNVEINPEDDVTGDCGTKCFVTDNGGAPYNANDVDNGNTILTSPVFDATIYQNPILNYYRRYLDIDGVGQPNDSMRITISNGSTSVRLETIAENDPTNGTWQFASFPLQSYITLTANMQFSVEVYDDAPGNIVEGALDEFSVTGIIITGIESPKNNSQALQVFPNPFFENFTIDIKDISGSAGGEVLLKDILGKTVFQKHISGNTTFNIGSDLSPGIYMLSWNDGKNSVVRKLIKESIR